MNVKLVCLCCGGCLFIVAAWHPVHESLFTTGGSDGAILFWLVGYVKDLVALDLWAHWLRVSSKVKSQLEAFSEAFGATIR